MLSLTMEEIGACIPFGAAHRVNIDTPCMKARSESRLFFGFLGWLSCDGWVEKQQLLGRAG